MACIVRSFNDLNFLKIFCAVGALVGIPLIQPYLSVTYFDQMRYSELIAAMQTLYNELKTCNPAKFCKLSQPALKFVSQERFESAISWPQEIIDDVQSYVVAHEPRIFQVL